MNKLEKIYYATKYWGLEYCYYILYDRIFHTDSANKFMYNYNSKISSDQYEIQLKKIYHMETGKKLDINNPRSFNEKIQWLKLHDTTLLKTKLTDKYMVREWVEKKIGESYLIPLVGVFNSLEELDIDRLPEKFVLKANHGSGCNMIVNDKKKLDWTEVEKNFSKWMLINFAWVQGLELQYKDIKPLIVVEQYIENGGNNLFDYKIYCFNGKAKYIQVIGNRDIKNHTAKEAFYSVDWEKQDFTLTYPRYEGENVKPKNLQKMIEIAEELAKEFIYVRVDLYELDDGTIKFGEMTFTPASGFDIWKPEEMDIILGEMMELPTSGN
ncbi:MAG: glycosyltransferase [Clostridia bacterium]|nr:glycosyltransferase [Clostridia bacterium]